MTKFYFFIILFFSNSLSYADSNVKMDKLLNSMECISCDFSELQLNKLNLWNYNISKSNFTNSNLVKK